MERKKEIEEIKTNFRKKLLEGIEDERTHNNLVSDVSYMFCQKYPLDYKPLPPSQFLKENGNPSKKLDFTFIKQKGKKFHLILGEVKSISSGGGETQALKKAIQQMLEAQCNLEKILSLYNLKKEDVVVSYALLVPEDYIPEIEKYLDKYKNGFEEDDGYLCLEEILASLLIIGRYWEQDRKRYLKIHIYGVKKYDPSLKSGLKKCVSSLEQIESNNSYLNIDVIISMPKEDFTVEEFEGHYNEFFPLYLDAEVRRSKIISFLEFCEKAGIIEKQGPRYVKKIKNAETISERAKDYWIKSKTDTSEDVSINIEKLMNEIETLKKEKRDKVSELRKKYVPCIKELEKIERTSENNRKIDDFMT